MKPAKHPVSRMLPLPLTVRGWGYFIFSAVVFTLGLLLNLTAYTNFASVDSVEWRASDFSQCTSSSLEHTREQN